MFKLFKWIRFHFYSKWIIPCGPYCYFGSRCPWDDTYRRCPYWKSVPSVHEQDNAYCTYLQLGDSSILSSVEESPSDFLWEGLGLLWDQVKECGVNDYHDFQEDGQQKTFFHKIHFFLHSSIYKVKKMLVNVLCARNSVGCIRLSDRFIDELLEIAYEEGEYKYVVILNSIMGHRLFHEDYSLQKSIQDIRFKMEFYQWDIERVISVTDGEDIPYGKIFD